MASKYILEFDNEEEFLTAVNGWKYEAQLEEVWQRVFRPNRKYGYDNKILDDEKSYDVIEELIDIYLKVITDE